MTCAVATAVFGCSGPSATPATPTAGAGLQSAAHSTTGSMTSNEPPSFERPAWRAVGVGQEIGFGLEVVDKDSDQFSVELAGKPASATFDPLTLTVVWTPTAADKPAGQFRVRITERQRETGTVRVLEHGFAIAVHDQPQPAPVAGPLDPAVENLLTIHAPARLAAINAKYPFDAMLHRSAQTVATSNGKTVKVPSGDVLYKQFLAELAKANDNSTVDMSSKAFDSKGFGAAKAWKLIAVRPRLDKKWHEVRLVYKAPSHAATYAMFKVRVVAGNAPPEARAYNNKVFSQLVADAFFTGGDLNPAHIADPAAHGKAVLDFVDAVFDHKGTQAWARGSFLGLPCEARLGGGSKRAADGSYDSGDAWGWNVMKIKPHDGELHMANVPIKGFATAVAPSKSGDSWAMDCAARFDADDAAHDPASASLCRASGHVDLPAAGDGYDEGTPSDQRVSSFVDAANMFVEHKTDHMVRELPLRDPRRDVFEEKGMTCSQCHVRAFGVRDMYDSSATDPRAGVPTRMNKSQPTSYFVLVPTERWQPYMVDFQHKQECKAKRALAADIGLQTSLSCPLKADQ